jgi:predicted dehydrogenase
MTALGVGIVGAGRFGHFVADAVAALPGLVVRAVADLQGTRAEALAVRLGVDSSSQEAMLENPALDIVVLAAPPAQHAQACIAALEQSKHVFCEKPLALDAESAREVERAVRRSGRVLVVDHVLRYNPLLAAVARVGEQLLGPVQRFLFENDASDEDLHPDHWFWDPATGGGIFIEHGVHFFDAATMLLGGCPSAVSAVVARRADGTVDSVSATCVHRPNRLAGAEALATHTHSFTHAHRCERQLMRLDFGAAEARIDGWIPVRATVDVWTDDLGAKIAESLPSQVDTLFRLDGFESRPAASLRLSRKPSASPGARARGRALDLPHHLRLDLSLGGPAAKQAVYAESVRAAMSDLLRCATTGGSPASGVRQGSLAVAVAEAATRSAAEGRTLPIGHPPLEDHPSTGSRPPGAEEQS